MKTRNINVEVLQTAVIQVNHSGDASISVAAGDSASYPASKPLIWRSLFFYMPEKSTSNTMQKFDSTN